jgi:hypothetical protein
LKATRSAAPVTSLQQLQSWLFERVTRAPSDADPAAVAADTDRDTNKDTNRDAELAQRVVSGNLSAAERVAVYRHGYFARLVECLEDDYPALAHALGAQCFEALCRDFIALHPPASASLNYYGAPFAAYCGRRPESWSAFARDLARLEWAVVEAIHAEEGERLDVSALGRLSPEQWSTARLVPSPALRLLFSAYPVEEFYRAFKQGNAAPLATDPSGSELPAPVASAVVVCRRGEDVWRIRLSVALGRLLESLLAGAPLLDALERFGSDTTARDTTARGTAQFKVTAAEATAFETTALAAMAEEPTAEEPIAPQELQRAFQDWVSCGLFSAVALN